MLLGRGNTNNLVLECLESGADLRVDSLIPTKPHLSVTKPKLLSDLLLNKFETILSQPPAGEMSQNELGLPLLLFLTQNQL